ncbi:MAG: RNA-binding transcriptional accessory protein [Proteobacteria bacterium]|nr:RNA-binding transcriptional accessory protein [Pseudomonadota bacterium]
MDVISTLAAELAVGRPQVEAAVKLLDEGATVPFIARYRKEVTQGLDDAQLRALETRLSYLRELEARRETILTSVREQGKLTTELEQAMLAAASKTLLEDLYLPFKPKRRTKAQRAREAGLEPLALGLLGDPTRDPTTEARGYVDPERGVADEEAALEGARQILMERFAEDAALLATLRERTWSEGLLCSRVAEGKEGVGAKFRDYFDHEEPLARIPSHRALALFRGRNEDVLRVTLRVAADEDAGHKVCEAMVARSFGIADEGRRADRWLLGSVRLAWKVKLLTRIDLDLKQRLLEVAEVEAIEVFARNLKDLLLAAPAGPRVTMGLDPGLRTGVKVAVVDATGKLLKTATIYPHPPRNDREGALATLAQLAQACAVELVAIGNGTASRESDALVLELIKRQPQLGLSKVVVSEAGASVYSASELASEELPELDVTLRGAVSIARRLQDPLAELVKIDPKAIGVGQYQHDVNQPRLARSLDAVVEDCVNAVGVDVNTASAALLRYVSGLSPSLSRHVVAHRNQHGPFANREQLRQVARFGDKTFEQAAGFLRVMQGDNPLDASAVHPEAYPLVQQIVSTTGTELKALLGNSGLLRRVNAMAYVDERFGLPTVSDVLKELEKPGRDPRPEFKSVTFRAGIEQVSDLQPGMWLEGVVTNVANFGAFVDVGVHQDGLVHISQLADSFVRDPREVVKAGAVVQVRVLAVDLPRQRISLSMKRTADQGAASDALGEARPSPKAPAPRHPGKARPPAPTPPRPLGAMAHAFAKALKK